MKGGNINNSKKRKDHDLLQDLLDNRLLQFVYRTSESIVRTIYHMARIVLLLIIIGFVVVVFLAT